MSLLTIIIPFLKNDSTERFEETLVSFLEHRTEDMDIIILNASVYEDHYEIKAEKGITFLPVGESTSYLEAINTGVRIAETELVHPVLCGVTVRDDWYLPILKRFENSSVSAVIPLVIETSEGDPKEKNILVGYLYERSGRVVEMKSSMGTRPWTRLAPHFSGAFYRRSALLELGGFQTDLYPLFAFVDMTLLISVLGGRTVLEINSHLYTSKEVLVPWQLDSISWCKEQERLYSRWNDWGGAFKTKLQHKLRILIELFSSLFKGGALDKLNAYRSGGSQEAVLEKNTLVGKIRRLRAAKDKN